MKELEIVVGAESNQPSQPTELSLRARTMQRVSNILIWRSRRERVNVLDDLISQPVLWCLVALYIPAGAAVLGLSFSANNSPTRCENGKLNAQSKLSADPNFLSLLWQTILQLLASYCSLVPVLRDRRKRIKAKMQRSKVVHDSVFYGAVAVSVVAAIMAPILYTKLDCGSNVSSSNALNFVSTITALIAASQLAARIEDDFLR